jgi:hypothetical protein
MRYWLVGLSSIKTMASSIQPIGFRGFRAARNVPTMVTGTTAAAVMNASTGVPPTPD